MVSHLFRGRIRANGSVATAFGAGRIPFLPRISQAKCLQIPFKDSGFVLNQATSASKKPHICPPRRPVPGIASLGKPRALGHSAPRSSSSRGGQCLALLPGLRGHSAGGLRAAARPRSDRIESDRERAEQADRSELCTAFSWVKFSWANTSFSLFVC